MDEERESILGHHCLSASSASNSPVHANSKTNFLDVFLTAVPLVFLAFFTVILNMMVLWMFKVKRSLRSCKNIYLGSLALADLLIGLCMFPALIKQLRGHVEWLPTFWCRFYLVVRQSALYVSLLSLVLITGDRWWSVHYPFSYRARRRTQNAVLAVTLVWLFSFTLHIPPVALWDLIIGTDPRATANSSDDGGPAIAPAASCELPFSHNIIFVSVASGVLYFIPLVAMLSLNCSLYVGILRRKQVQIRRSVRSSDKLCQYDGRSSSSSITDAGEGMQLLSGFGQRRNPWCAYFSRRQSMDSVRLKKSLSAPQFSSDILQALAGPRRSSWAPRKTSFKSTKGGEELARSLLVRQDRKAALGLALLVIAFLLCWLPHTVVGILQSAWYSSVSQRAKDVTFWFLLANSAINPLLYGLFNKEMRSAFKQWLCGGQSSHRLRTKHALLFYSVNFNAALSVSKKIISFDTVPE